MSRFYAILLGLLVLLTAATGWAAETDLDVSLVQLDASLSRQQLTVTYDIQPKSWKQLRKAGIQPQLVLREATRDGRVDFRFAAKLDARQGTLAFPRELVVRPSDRLMIAIEGANGFSHVATTTFGERCGPAIPLEVRGVSGKQDGPQHHGDKHRDDKAKDHKRGNYAAAIVEACGKASKSNPSQCVSLAGNLPERSAAETIDACGEQTQWDSELHQCLKAATAFVDVAPAQTIRACGDATSWNSEMLTCMSAAASHLYPAEDVVACDAHTQWASELKQCLVVSEPLGRNAAGVIQACGSTTQWNSELTACIKNAATLRRRG